MAKLRQLPTGVNTSSRTVVRAATGVVYQPHPKYSLGEADNQQPNSHIAYKTLRDITITAALQPIHNCRNPQKIITNYCAIKQQNRATFRQLGSVYSIKKFLDFITSFLG